MQFRYAGPLTPRHKVLLVLDKIDQIVGFHTLHDSHATQFRDARVPHTQTQRSVSIFFPRFCPTLGSRRRRRMRLLLAVLSFSQWPSASSTALAPGGSDVMLFTAPPDELFFPLTGPAADSSERTDLPCDDGPYILDLCDCGEGLGSSFKSHKTALAYATALRAKYIDLPLYHGTKIKSAEPVPDDANVRRANAAAAEPPRRAKEDIFDDHDKLNYSPFFGLGSAKCNAASLQAHRAAATGHLTFVDAVQQQIEPQAWPYTSPTSNVHMLCARLESGLGGVDRPSNELFDTDPTLSHVSTELGGHTQRKLSKLVLVFSYEFRHVDLNFCVISPEFRQRWRT
eukprot:scaffold5827_cov80-Phaeocystis_antarctica.AAC.2